MKPLHAAMGFAIIGLLTSTGRAQEGQSPPISTERPTVGNSPDLVPRGSMQLENGAGVSLQRRQYTADLPESLLRLGLSERAEVRFSFSEEMYQTPPEAHTAALQTTDPSLSVKIGLGKPGQMIPRSAILSFSLPRGGPSWTSGSYDPALTAIWTQTVGAKYFINEVAGATLTTFAGARRPYWAPSVAGGRCLSSTVTAFGEYAPTVLPDGDWQYVVDGGLSLAHKNLAQFDLRAGYLRDAAGYHTLLTIGYSVRRDGILPRFSHGFGR